VRCYAVVLDVSSNANVSSHLKPFLVLRGERRSLYCLRQSFPKEGLSEVETMNAVKRKIRRRPRGTPHDPIFAFRAPPSIAEVVKTEAARRGVTYSDVAREALEAFVSALANGREELRASAELGDMLSEDRAA